MDCVFINVDRNLTSFFQVCRPSGHQTVLTQSSVRTMSRSQEGHTYQKCDIDNDRTNSGTTKNKQPIRKGCLSMSVVNFSLHDHIDTYVSLFVSSVSGWLSSLVTEFSVVTLVPELDLKLNRVNDVNASASSSVPS